MSGSQTSRTLRNYATSAYKTAIIHIEISNTEQSLLRLNHGNQAHLEWKLADADQ